MSIPPISTAQSPCRAGSLPGARRIGAIAAVTGALVAAHADVVQLTPVRDTTLYESVDGSLSNGAGAYFFAGLTPRGELRRGLMAFSVAGAIPSGATIMSVSLQLSMSRTGTPAAIFELHRATADWGEGESDADGDEGRGAPAAFGDATWIHRSFDSVTWTNAGGDFESSASAALMIDTVGLYTWQTTPQLVADVQAWLDHPASNHGWLLRGDESTASSKRFNSRQNLSSADWPMLTIEYAPPDSCPGDLNGDLVVSFADAAILFSHLDTWSGATHASGDMDADGDVEMRDFALFQDSFAAPCP